MLSLFTNSKPWMVASLFVATAAFGQQDGKCAPKSAKCEQPAAPCVKVCPCPQPKLVLNPAYNAPAAINTRCSWDANINASFIFWQPSQDNMELGFAMTTPYANFIADPATATSGIQGNHINMDFKFKPGFKVGLGMAFDHDDWDVQAEYTWFHNTNHRSSNGPALPGSIIPAWGTFTEAAPNVYTSVSESWRLNMDLVDLDLGRMYYVGTKLTMRPSFGARAAFIRQNVHVINELNATGAVSTTLTANKVDIKQRVNSWGLGTKAALETNWLIGEGFRLFGNGEADLLFTRYTKSNYKSTLATPAGFNESIAQKNINTLRTHLDFVTGLAYGTYLDCNNWHLDISLGYEFQVFYDQNMFGNVVDVRGFDASTSHSNGHLYIQGLTAKVEFDF